jgi:hypothetical protein
VQHRGELLGDAVVDIVHGVHAMISKSLFAGELRRQIAVV